MERSVVTRLGIAAFEPGRDSKAWTARSANTLESSHSGLENASSVCAGLPEWRRARRTDVSSTGEWYLGVTVSPRARGAEHTAEASGTDAFLVTRSSPIAKLHLGNFKTSSRWDGLDLHSTHD